MKKIKVYIPHCMYTFLFCSFLFSCTSRAKEEPIELLGYKTKVEVVLQHDQDDYIWDTPNRSVRNLNN